MIAKTVVRRHAAARASASPSACRLWSHVVFSSKVVDDDDDGAGNGREYVIYVVLHFILQRRDLVMFVVVMGDISTITPPLPNIFETSAVQTPLINIQLL